MGRAGDIILGAIGEDLSRSLFDDFALIGHDRLANVSLLPMYRSVDCVTDARSRT
jgi:hypothetical protein